MDQALVEYLDRRFRELREDLRQDLSQDLSQEFHQEFRQLRAELAASAAETRRHFGVVAEQLMGKLQLVGEGVVGLDQKVDQLATEMRGEFQKVDRRFLHLEARVIG